jgi:hypothetical protein
VKKILPRLGKEARRIPLSEVSTEQIRSDQYPHRPELFERDEHSRQEILGVTSKLRMAIDMRPPDERSLPLNSRLCLADVPLGCVEISV